MIAQSFGHKFRGAASGNQCGSWEFWGMSNSASFKRHTEEHQYYLYELFSPACHPRRRREDSLEIIRNWSLIPRKIIRLHIQYNHSLLQLNIPGRMSEFGIVTVRAWIVTLLLYRLFGWKSCLAPTDSSTSILFLYPHDEYMDTWHAGLIQFTFLRNTDHSAVIVWTHHVLETGGFVQEFPLA